MSGGATAAGWRMPRHLVLLILILIGAAVLRMVRLDTLPPALFRDEAEKAYNAYSLLTTMRDANGQFLPIFIKVFGVTTSAVYQYATIPFIAVCGLSEWGARLPAAAVGVITVLLTCLAAGRVYGNSVGLFAALFLAVSPWHIVFSRWAQQGIFVPMLLVGALLAWSYTIDESKSEKLRLLSLCLATVCLGLAIYAYDVARLFVPLLILACGVIYWRLIRARPRWFLAAGSVFLLALSPVLYLVFFQVDAAQARFRFVSIWQPGSSLAEVLLTFQQNYAAHLSPTFLLLRGDSELRHGAGVGVLSWFEAAMLLVGVLTMAVRRGRLDLLCLCWVVLFPVAASLTRIGVPHALRSIVALPILQVIAAVGVHTLLARVPSRQFRTAVGGAVLLTVAGFLPFAQAYYSRDYQVRSAVSWQYGVKRALGFLDEPAFREATVYFDTTTLYGAEYLVAFYAKLPPRDFQVDYYGRFKFIAPGSQFRPRPGALAFVHVPLTPGPVGWRPIAFFPLDETSPGPALMVYLSPELQKRIATP